MSVRAIRLRPTSWMRSPSGKAPWPLAAALLLFPVVVAWTLPQTFAGAVLAIVARLRGHRGAWYRFGPFLYYVVPRPLFVIPGISLGVVVFADDPVILTHEFCHLYTAAWLAWAYLPVYGIEYAIVGHDRSPHERLTNRFESRSRLAWWRIGSFPSAGV